MAVFYSARLGGWKFPQESKIPPKGSMTLQLVRAVFQDYVHKVL